MKSRCDNHQNLCNNHRSRSLPSFPQSTPPIIPAIRPSRHSRSLKRESSPPPLSPHPGPLLEGEGEGNAKPDAIFQVSRLVPQV